MRKLLLSLVLLFMAVQMQAQSQGVLVTAGPFTKAGNLYVCPSPSGGTPCPTPSQIFADVGLAQPLSNPISTPAQTIITFYIAAGQYTLEMPASGVQQVINAGSGSATTGAFLPGCNVTQNTCLGTATTPAVADWKTITDGTCANSSTAISWGTLNEITTADVGKVIDITSPGGGNTWQSTTLTTIATVNQAAKTGTISAATIGGGCGTPVTFDIYTDNGPAFNTFELAIHNSTLHKGIIWYPCGIYGAGTAFWNQTNVNDSISYWGGGGGHQASTVGQCTVIKVSPAIFAAVSGSGLQAFAPANGDMRDLVVDGENIVTAATACFLISWNGVMDVSNVQFVAFLGTNGNTATLCHSGSDNFTSRNLSCNFKDQKGYSLNTLNSVFINPSFSGNPGLDLSDSVASFYGGAIGTNASVAANALTTSGGSGQVMSTFYGTQFNSSGSATPSISITKPGANPVQINLIGVEFNCGHTSNAALWNIGAGAIMQMTALGNTNATGTTGCLGTSTVSNSGTFIDGGANGFGATGMQIAWSGAGVYQMNCNSWQVAPTISSGFGTSPSIPSGVSSCTFRVNVGGGGVATSGVISLGQAAPNGWNCTAIDQTTNTVTRQTANTTTTVTLTAAAAWGANDILNLHCDPF